jgi:hypothetical protein
LTDIQVSTMSSAQKRIIEDIALSGLRELADAAYQERVWVKGSATEVSSLNEAVATLFDDSGLDVALEKNVVTFTPEIDAELRDLRSMLRACLNRQSRQTAEDLINSSEWNLVRERAKRLLAKVAIDQGNLHSR